MFLRRVVFLILLLSGVHLWAVPGTEEGIKKLPEELREEARSILKKYQELQKLPQNERKVHLDLNDGVQTSVFSKSGITSTNDCAADKPKKSSEACKSLGWPDNKSNLTSTGNLDFQFEEDEDGNKILKTYTEVNFSYDREGLKTGTGWVSQDVVSFEPTISSYSEIVMNKISEAQVWLGEKWEEICKPATKGGSSPLLLAPASKNNWLAIYEVTKKVEEKVVVENQERRTVSEIASELSSSVGQCILDVKVEEKKTEKGQIEVNVDVTVPKSFSGNLTYDQFVLPSMQKHSLPKNIRKEDGTPFTQKDLIAVDTMARSLYAEMARCVELGSHYQMAIARVFRNREKAILDNPNAAKEFLRHQSEHSPNKSLLSQVVTSPVQVSAWNQEVIDFDKLKDARRGEVKALMKQGVGEWDAWERAKKIFKPNMETKRFYKNNESGLLHTLCPPSDPKKICYAERKPNLTENAAWESSLRVAVEAVLFPTQFDRKTAQLEGIKHYTSGRTKFYDYTEVFPSIDGRKINSRACLNLWKERPKKKKK